MRTTKVLSVTLPPTMLSETEKVAKRENRTKSELIQEALRHYFLDQEWRKIRSIGKTKVKTLKLKPTDVNRFIKAYRAEETAKQTKRH